MPGGQTTLTKTWHARRNTCPPRQINTANPYHPGRKKYIHFSAQTGDFTFQQDAIGWSTVLTVLACIFALCEAFRITGSVEWVEWVICALHGRGYTWLLLWRRGQDLL